MYVKALCQRFVKAQPEALVAYAKVMKMEYEISDYEHKIVIPENMSSLALKRVDGPGFPGWKIDLYSHFKRLNLLRENNALHMVDLEPHYRNQGQNPDDKGWMIDDLE